MRIELDEVVKAVKIQVTAADRIGRSRVVNRGAVRECSIMGISRAVGRIRVKRPVTEQARGSVQPV
ncbi:MAG: hypothetical protein N0E42_15520 [Candidatus Thiodiazotropha endolucinida]|nr:hypothetical protein [Candidatus Thiodiazotropha taylori]MCW4225877.1 hypothetical protein [Candidatus Thiodiazotropha endolucinida]MCG8101347.1 hypothetical protein [Candidatus Thiodiazotropha taylori]MCG8115996.1 hypothetical protein [Candidatus Thiodiazotropha taylori]MCG8118791.1 hypothetical protein [Candidatus Thiodiazotropha taylori]